MEGGLTFTIGKGFGQILQRIAWEKLTEKYNPREAVEIITKSLPGCTEGMAVDILDGKIILGEDEATQEVTGRPGAGGKFNDWIKSRRIQLEEEAKPRSTNSIVTGKHVARECYFSGPRKNQ